MAENTTSAVIGTMNTSAKKYKLEFNTDGSTKSIVLGEVGDDPVEIVERVFPAGVEPAHVAVSNSMKMNMGNYESAEVFCSVSLPCLTSEIPDTFQAAWAIARNELKSQLTRLDAVRKQRGVK